MSQDRKPSPEQRKRALVSGLVLAAMAFGIYGVVILKFFAHP
jgi:hypothetical protein